MSEAYRAGQSIEDYCRACKTDRQHTIIAVDLNAHPLRVMCGYCDSQHNYRGGGRVDTGHSAPGTPHSEPSTRAPHSATRTPHTATSTRTPHTALRTQHGFATVSESERSAPPVMVQNESGVDLEMLLRRIIREEAGVTPVAPAEKWRGGTLVLRPGKPGVQEKSWPIETFFHKIVMLRNRLRTAEQQLNASDLPDDVKLKLQGYISGCYGSLTSFNVLFAEDEDTFKG